MCDGILQRFYQAMLQLGIAIGFIILIAATATADEQNKTPSAPAISQVSTNLLTATDLQSGWIQQQAGAAGWVIDDGKLTGNAKSTPLISKRLLHDFELHVTWKVIDGGVIKLGFLKTPQEKPIEICLAERPGISIRLPQGAKILKVDSQLYGKFHRLVIKRAGDVLVLDCDGTRSRELPVPADDQFCLSLAMDGKEANASGTIELLKLVTDMGSASNKLAP